MKPFAEPNTQQPHAYKMNSTEVSLILHTDIMKEAVSDS